jgi:pimeloyl-ACP methyl ester carboxylesterase
MLTAARWRISSRRLTLPPAARRADNKDMPRCKFEVGFILVLAATSFSTAEEPLPASAAGPVNFPSATLGGTQFWTDELVFRDWRIQQNCLTGHYRLLDGDDFRRAWGTFDQCRTKLDELKRELRLAPMSGRAIVTVHGLGRSRDAMNLIGEHLAAHSDALWINVGYASSRRSLDEHAQSLARVLANLEGVEKIDLVCHSLGNLVVRRYLGEATLPEPRWQPDARIRRMVMIGPPNNGAQLARLFKDNTLYGLVTGPSGKQLAVSWEEAQKRLATPTFEFGIIAGGLGNGRGTNPVVDGDDDLIVAVEETRLPGAADFVIVPRLHGNLLRDERVCQCVQKFLDEGHFVSDEKRTPIPRGEPPASAGERGASAP